MRWQSRVGECEGQYAAKTAAPIDFDRRRRQQANGSKLNKTSPTFTAASSPHSPLLSPHRRPLASFAPSSQAALRRCSLASVKRKRCCLLAREPCLAPAGAPAVTTASKKRKTATGALQSDSAHIPDQATASHPPREGARLASPRSSPLPATASFRGSASPPRFLPPHMQEEVLDATHEPSTATRDPSASVSSPSEAYANMTLEGESDADRSRPADLRAHPRASSPAKRLHSDIDSGSMDVDGPSATRRGSGQSSPLAAKPTAGPSSRNLRSTSVEMADVTTTSSDSPSPPTADTTASSLSASPGADAPSIDDQVEKVLALSRKPLQDRQVGYIVSQKWLERVWARTTQYADKQREFSKSAVEGEIGPVDNSDLVDTAAASIDLVDRQGEQFIPLRKGLMLENEYEILPVEAWELVLSWYGLKEGTPVIKRYVHNTSMNPNLENLQYEIYPPIFTIRKVRKTSPSTHERSKVLVASRSESFADFTKAAKQAAGIDLQNNIRIWRVLHSNATSVETAPRSNGILTPEASPPPPAVPALIIDAASLTQMSIGTEREEVTGKDELSSEPSGGDANLASVGLAEDQVLILEEQDEKGEFITGLLSKPALKSALSIKNGKTKSTTTSGRSTPAPSGAMTRGRTRNGRTRGTTGLANLGNTCYMNSALQCIRSVEELAIYFLSGDYKRDINSDNPLGHGGSIAKSYAGLLASIYDESGTSSFAPKNFKNTLGRAAAIFSGYGQQDSQEFLSFLVDGLHEDLNRIKKKPYTENPESDDNTVHDPAAIKELGDKIRAIHHSRNDSVAMDLFNGFYKNTMVCPECEKVSITFDPYSLVTLQLPIEQTFQHTMKFMPANGKMYLFDVDISKNATIKTLKEYVSKRFPVDPSRLVVSEIFSHKFYQHLTDKDCFSELNFTARDEIFVYEVEDVPTNTSNLKKKKTQYNYNSLYRNDSDEEMPKVDDARHDRIMVPLFHRRPTQGYNARQAWALDLWPSYIVVNREEAKDYDAILKKALARVAQMTTRDILAEGTTQSGSGSDVVVTTEEDASSDGDSRVQAGSMEGEDMVEVTMSEPTDTANAPSGKQIPEVLRPDSFLPPSFRNLFEMKYIRAERREQIPTGWNTLDTNKTYDPISKRVRAPSTRASSAQSEEAGSNASSEEDDNPQFSADVQSSLDAANQSSDEDMQPSIEEPPTFARGGRRGDKKSKKMRKQERKHLNNKNYRGKKGKNRYMDQPSQAYNEPEDEDDERLIRMGEAIVLDWNSEAFDALFGGSNASDSRGQQTLQKLDRYEDKELQAKKAKRAARRRNGLTLDECFAETSRSEVLSEDNAWYCSRCKELRRAMKTLEIWTAPDILVVHLKRFSSHRVMRDKIDTLVDFPIEGLDLSNRVGLAEGKELVYDLFAVDNHYGGLGGGHYTAFAKNFFDQQWYEYNDSSVSKRSNPENVITPAAYLLFYRRRSAGPLGPPELQKIVNAWRNPDSEDATNSEGDGVSRNASPSGNGLRLDGSSRNGLSSAFGAGAAVGALRGGGSGGTAGSLLQNGAAAGSHDEDDSPPDYDEGFDEPYNNSLAQTYAPLHGESWSFAGVPSYDDDSDGAAMGDDDLHSRMTTDFDMDEDTIAPGNSTPQGDEDGVQQVIPALIDDDDNLAEIHN